MQTKRLPCREKVAALSPSYWQATRVVLEVLTFLLQLAGLPVHGFVEAVAVVVVGVGGLRVDPTAGVAVLRRDLAAS